MELGLAAVATWALWILLGLIFMAVVVQFPRYFKLWLRAVVANAQISVFSLVLMPFRKVNPNVIVDSKILAIQGGLENISNDALESHYLAGGNVSKVVQALIAANRAQIDLDWDTAATIDLAGRDVVEAVQLRVNSR